MANLQGIRLYRELSASGTESSYANKDISSLAIIAPWRVTARVRLFASLVSGHDGFFILSVGYGGVSDDKYQVGRVEASANSLIDRAVSLVNAGNAIGGGGFVDTNGITALTQEDWLWVEIECDADRNITVKTKDDNTTTRPTTWDNEFTNPTTANATPTQEVQSVEVRAYLNSSTTSNGRIIMEVDEIYVTQD